jgi:hypothetical protein
MTESMSLGRQVLLQVSVSWQSNNKQLQQEDRMKVRRLMQIGIRRQGTKSIPNLQQPCECGTLTSAILPSFGVNLKCLFQRSCPFVDSDHAFIRSSVEVLCPGYWARHRSFDHSGSRILQTFRILMPLWMRSSKFIFPRGFSNVSSFKEEWLSVVPNT